MARRGTGSGHSCLSRADCPRLWLGPHPLGSHIREPLVPTVSQASACSRVRRQFTLPGDVGLQGFLEVAVSTAACPLQ